MTTRRREAEPRREGPRRLPLPALVPLLVLGLLAASIAGPPSTATAHERKAPARTTEAPGSSTRTSSLVAPSLVDPARAPSPAAAATPTQIRAALVAVNALLLVPEPSPAASGAAGTLALTLLAGIRVSRRRS